MNPALEESRMFSAIYFNTQHYFYVLWNRKKDTESKYARLVYLFSDDFGCNMQLCNWQIQWQNAAQKVDFLWRDVIHMVHSCASVSHQTSLLNILLAGIPKCLGWYIYIYVYTRTHLLGRSFFCLAVLSLFLKSLRNTTQNCRVSLPSPIFRLSHWNSMFLFSISFSCRKSTPVWGTFFFRPLCSCHCSLSVISAFIAAWFFFFSAPFSAPHTKTEY